MKTPAVRLIIAALAATAALVACTKETTPPSFENDKVNPEGTRVIAVAFAPQTKTELDGFQPKFVDNDSILISNGNAIDTCDVKVEGNVATISTNLTGPLTAVYPYKAAKMNDNNHNLIDTVLVSTEQDGTFASANICMARMTGENEESLSFENKTAVFCIYPPTNSPGYVEVKAEGFNIANDYPDGSTYTTCNTIHVAPINTDSVYVSILVPDGLTIGKLTFSDGTKEKAITTGAQAGEEIAAGTLYTVTATDWASPEADIPEPLSGKFSVSADKQVQFSQGNLRYVVGTQEWGFYEHQYGHCNTSTYNGRHSDTVSLFTWGYDATKSIDPSGKNDVYGHITDGDLLNSDEDWGSQIGDGNTWRTLTTEEWQYLFNSRTDAASKVGYATVDGVKGLIILPDDFADPMKNNGSGAFIPKSSTGWEKNVYTSGDNWNAMESAGAVFLPAAGDRNGSGVYDVGIYAYYWSSTAHDSGNAYRVHFLSNNVYPGNFGNRSYGCSVRLVTDVPAAPDPTEPDYVVITAKYDGEDNPDRPLKWSRQNLAITDSGNKKWKGENDTAVKVPGTNEDVIVGDYFQWAAYAGYCGNDTDADKGLLIYDSFTNTKCVDGGSEDSFEFKSTGEGKEYQFERDLSADGSYVGISPYYSDLTSDYIKYTKTTYSEGDGKNVLEKTDDVANIILGGNWRMPTSDEFKAMGDATYWAWDEYDCGYYVFAPNEDHLAGDMDEYIQSDLSKNDALLFFPATGYGEFSSLNLEPPYGYYFSSSLCTNASSVANNLHFEYNFIKQQSNFSRHCGVPVRPVSD